MGLAATTCWEVQPSTSSDGNGGGFNPGNANFMNDGNVTLANTSAPLFAPSGYVFVASDIGHRVFIKSGLNVTPGYYTITSVPGGAAVLNAAIGAVELYVGGIPAGINTVLAGCGTAATLSTVVWGLDYSRKGPRFAYTDLSAGGAGSTFTSAINPFTNYVTGNLIQVTSGTNCVTGWFEIVSVAGGTATFDRAVTTGVTSNGAAAHGGAFLTVSRALVAAVAQNQIFIKGGAYTTAANPTITPGSIIPDAGVVATTVSGYVTVRGDFTRANRSSWPVITATTGCSTLIPLTTNGWIIQGLVLDCNGVTNTTASTACISATGNYVLLRSLWLKNFKLAGFNQLGGRISIEQSEISGGLAGATAALNVASGTFLQVRQCEIHANVCSGFIGDYQQMLLDNLIYNNSGATSDGISTGGQGIIQGNRIYNNGRDGIRFTGTIAASGQTHSNIITNNGGYGMNYPTGDTVYGDASWDGNAYFNNTSGARHNVGTGTADIIMTGDPYNNAAAADFSINNIVGAGALLRAASYTFPSGTTSTLFINFGSPNPPVGLSWAVGTPKGRGAP